MSKICPSIMCPLEICLSEICCGTALGGIVQWIKHSPVPLAAQTKQDFFCFEKFKFVLLFPQVPLPCLSSLIMDCSNENLGLTCFGGDKRESNMEKSQLRHLWRQNTEVSAMYGSGVKNRMSVLLGSNPCGYSSLTHHLLEDLSFHGLNQST